MSKFVLYYETEGMLVVLLPYGRLQFKSAFSAFVTVKLLDIFEKKLGQFPALFVVTKIRSF